jgi:hypothetical protein
MNPVHTLPPYFLKIHYHSVGSSKWYLTLRFSDQNFVLTSHVTHREAREKYKLIIQFLYYDHSIHEPKILKNATFIKNTYAQHKVT